MMYFGHVMRADGMEKERCWRVGREDEEEDDQERDGWRRYTRQ